MGGRSSSHGSFIPDEKNTKQGSVCVGEGDGSLTKLLMTFQLVIDLFSPIPPLSLLPHVTMSRLCCAPPGTALM